MPLNFKVIFNEYKALESVIKRDFQEFKITACVRLHHVLGEHKTITIFPILLRLYPCGFAGDKLCAKHV